MELALDHVGDDRFVLAGVGELQALPSYAAEISAGRRAWRCARALRGFGQVVNAVDVDSGERAARYVPGGFMRREGVHAGEFRIGDHVWSWGANHEHGTHFVLSYGDVDLGEFDIGPPQQPVLVALARAARSSPMLVLMCCYVVRLAADSRD